MKIYEIPIEKKTINDGDTQIAVHGKGFYNNKIADKASRRYLLKIYIDENAMLDSPKALSVIMFNPSEYGNKQKDFFIDKTITNVIKIANDNSYKEINVLNLFSEIKSNSKNVNISIKDKKNITFLINYFNENKHDVLLAWGTIKDNKFIKTIKWDIYNKLLEKEMNIYTFCANKNRNFPKHPANIDIECCRHCYGRNGIILLESLEYKKDYFIKMWS